MRSKTVRILYAILTILLTFLIFQELFPILLTMPITPNSYLIIMNYPLVTGILLTSIPIVTANSFKKVSEQEYGWLNLIKFFTTILIVCALITLFLPYVSHNGLITGFGFNYLLYSGIFGLFLIIFGYIQVIINRIFFGFLIGISGAVLGLWNQIKFFFYLVQQSYIIFEFGFYIGILTWVMLLLLNLIYMIKSYSPDQIQ